jgi:Xaa-Pro aminopeptidase
MTTRFEERRDKLRRAIRKAGAEALLVTDFINVTYLTGFTGDDSYLLVRLDGETILSDGRYTTQLDEECPELDRHIRKPGAPMHKEVAKVVGKAKLAKLGIEADSITVGLRNQIADEMPKVELVVTSGLVEQLRQIKDKDEIAQTREAVRFAEKAFEVLKATLRPDKTEKEIADELEHQMRLFGAKTAAFPSIVAVGARAALPHAKPGLDTVASSSMLLVDWGAEGRLYKSDLTRTLVTGKIPPKLQEVYGVVLRAQLAGIEAIRPGVKAVDVDRVAREIIHKAGYGRYFDHGLGHGVGLQIHEGLRLNPVTETQLEAGMIVTVEPGIYLPGRFGVRIEDDVLVTRSGHEVLTSVPKQWDEIVIPVA